MAEKFADLRQRSSLPKHLRGERVAELMGSFASGIDAGSFQRMSNHRTDPTLAVETANWRFGALQK